MTFNHLREMALLLLAGAMLVSPAATAAAQPLQPPPPPGNRIVVQDGDVVVVEHGARVSIVRSRQASVRVVFDAAERWLLLLVDLVAPGIPADGSVDNVYHFSDVEGTWPFVTPWQGVAAIEDYSTVPTGNTGLGIATPEGLVLIRPHAREEREDTNAAAILTHSSGGNTGSGDNLTFDAAERWYSAELRRNDGVIRSPSGGSTSISGRVRGGIVSVNHPDVPARVGGGIRPPSKIFHVDPVMPETALRANVRGTVILEVTVDVDGSVKEARVLRSIPLLDAAAREAVRQWRYEPTIIRGKSAPVVITVPVTF